jgi:trans-2,3-dihydro-3-hydroxyanthranilate isomerase
MLNKQEIRIMRYRYHILDVFTDRTFGGNQLAVLPDARGLEPATMQRIAREFNFSESTFVLPPEDAANTRRVRIFTPFRELPFAGHPNIGTAVALVASGEVGAGVLHFEEGAGLVPVRVEQGAGGALRAELTAPQPPELGDVFEAAELASALGLTEADIVIERHPPRLVSAGIPFLCIELRDCAALARSRLTSDAAEQLAERATGFLVYTRDTGEDLDLRMRMYAPAVGVAEDPATGSAAAALAGLLASIDPRADAELHWRIAQGVEMGRPSLLEASADKRGGKVGAIRVGGAAVRVAEGWIEVPRS